VKKKYLLPGLSLALAVFAAVQTVRLRTAREAGEALARQAEDLQTRVEALETVPAPQGSAASAWAEIVDMDPERRTVTLAVRAEVPGGGDPFFLNVRQEGASTPVELRRLPDGARGGEVSIPLVPDSRLEITLADGTVLFCRDAMADLLPVQLSASCDLLAAEGMAYLRECRIALTTPQGGWAKASQMTCQVLQNGEVVQSVDCEALSGGIVEPELWTLPLSEGETLSYHFLCTDAYGLQYDFTLGTCPNTGEVSGRPAVTWPD